MISASVHQMQTLGDQYLILSLLRPNGFHYQAGQYVTFEMSGASGDAFQRSYSIASAPLNFKTLEFCIQTGLDGKGAEFFKKLRVGSLISMSPALGAFSIRDSKAKLVFIAGGSGISPMRSLILEGLKSNSSFNALLVYGCKDAKWIPFREEFQSLPIECLITADSDGLNPVEALKKRGVDPQAHYYLCGPPGLMLAMRALLAEQGVPAEHVFAQG